MRNVGPRPANQKAVTGPEVVSALRLDMPPKPKMRKVDVTSATLANPVGLALQKIPETNPGRNVQ